MDNLGYVNNEVPANNNEDDPPVRPDFPLGNYYPFNTHLFHREILIYETFFLVKFS